MTMSNPMLHLIDYRYIPSNPSRYPGRVVDIIRRRKREYFIVNQSINQISTKQVINVNPDWDAMIMESIVTYHL